MEAQPTKNYRLVFVDKPDGSGAIETWEEIEAPSLPPLGTQALGFVKTAVAVAASGFIRATEEEKAARLSVCQGCPDHYRAEDQRCGAESGCGCFLPEKVLWKAASCPVGKW